MYVIFDSAAQIYNKPFGQQNDQVAIRGCDMLRNDPNTECYFNPEQFSLFKIGEYEDTTAVFTPQTHHCVIKFHEIPKRQNELFENQEDLLENLEEKKSEIEHHNIMQEVNRRKAQ